MKTTLIGVALLALAASGFAQTATTETPWAVSSREAHQRVWQRTLFESGPSGELHPVLHQYVELAAGLCYRRVSGEWADTKEEFELVPGKAIARGQHSISLNYNLNSAGAVEMETPDGKLLKSHVLGLSYFDSATGESVLIAEVKDCAGTVTGNQVVYADAFTDFQADVRFTYTKAGFEQDIILREQPPRPEEYGLNPETTRLQVLTEFLNPPRPDLESGVIESGDMLLQDMTLGFGVMKVGPGKAFLLERGRKDVPVGKQWLNLEGRDFLIEEVAMPELESELELLPAAAESASLKPVSGSARHVVSTRRRLPSPKLARTSTNEIRMVQSPRSALGLVLDYTILNGGGSTNYTFQGDMTYYVSGSFTCYGTNTFEGGTVLKFAANGSVTLSPGPGFSPGLNWKGGAYHPVIFTAKDDNTVGENVGSGTPAGFYGSPMLLISGNAEQHSIRGLRVSYAQTGIQYSGASADLRSVQFVNCQNALKGGQGNVTVGNGMFANTKTNCVIQGSTIVTLQNATVSGSLYLAAATQSGGVLALTNCILADVTNLLSGVLLSTNGDYNGFYRAPYVSHLSPVSFTNVFYPFRTVGGGKYYLTNGCGFRDVGSADVEEALLEELQTKTTYPPIAYTNFTFACDTTFSPHVQRDIDVPDLGYHYDPLDYAFGGCTANSNLTFTAGTAAGWWYYGAQGIRLGNYRTAAYDGTASAPCIWSRLRAVQEQDRTTSSGTGGLTSASGTSSTASTVQARFTRCYQVNGGGNHFRDNGGWLNLRARDCEFYCGGIGGYVISMFFTNCVFERVYNAQIDGNGGCGMVMRNCTKLGERLELTPNKSTAGRFSIWDSSFDQVTCKISGYAANFYYADYDYNASDTATNPFPAACSGTHILTNVVFNWQSGQLGYFYLPGDSVLVDAGSQTADDAGLHYYTTQTSSYSLEGSYSPVDIGYHYVASDYDGNALDTDYDGVPDYLEDANGNGLIDSGETDPEIGTDPGLKVMITRPQNGSTLP